MVKELLHLHHLDAALLHRAASKDKAELLLQQRLARQSAAAIREQAAKDRVQLALSKAALEAARARDSTDALLRARALKEEALRDRRALLSEAALNKEALALLRATKGREVQEAAVRRTEPRAPSSGGSTPTVFETTRGRVQPAARGSPGPGGSTPTQARPTTELYLSHRAAAVSTRVHRAEPMKEVQTHPHLKIVKRISSGPRRIWRRPSPSSSITEGSHSPPHTEARLHKRYQGNKIDLSNSFDEEGRRLKVVKRKSGAEAAVYILDKEGGLHPVRKRLRS